MKGTKLVVALAVLAGLAGLLEPRLLASPAEVLGSLARRMALARDLEDVPGVGGSIVALVRAADDAMWVADKQELVRFARGDTGAGEVLLSPERYERRFATRMDPLSAVHVAGSAEAWVGTWYGTVLRLEGDAWRRIDGGRDAPRGRITAIQSLGAERYVAAQGLWVWSPEFTRLRKVPDFPGKQVTALARDAHGALLVGGEPGVWRRSGRDWLLLWRAAPADVEVLALAVTRDGELLIGTHDGYQVLDAWGRALVQELPGTRVTGFGETRDGALWVTTLDDGIHVRRAGRWRHVGVAHGLERGALGAIALDARGRAWLGSHQDGAAVVASDALLESSTPHARDAAALPGDVYRDACEAAARRLGAQAQSGQVAVETVDGAPTLFFAGRQVCPAGVGHRRDGDNLVSIAGRAPSPLLRVRTAGATRLVPLPSGKLAATPVAVHLDRRGRTWLALAGRGLFVLGDDGWRAIAELARRTVHAIDEDARGDLWVAADDALRRFDGERWQRFDADAPDASNGVRALGDGRIALAGRTGLGIGGAGRFARHTRAGGLDSNHVADVVEGPEGRLWLVHGRWGHGVSWLDGERATGRGAADGLFNDDLARLAFDAEGNLWLQASRGETAVYAAADLLSPRARE